MTSTPLHLKRRPPLSRRRGRKIKFSFVITHSVGPRRNADLALAGEFTNLPMMTGGHSSLTTHHATYMGFTPHCRLGQTVRWNGEMTAIKGPTPCMRGATRTLISPLKKNWIAPPLRTHNLPGVRRWEDTKPPAPQFLRRRRTTLSTKNWDLPNKSSKIESLQTSTKCSRKSTPKEGKHYSNPYRSSECSPRRIVCGCLLPRTPPRLAPSGGYTAGLPALMSPLHTTSNRRIAPSSPHPRPLVVKKLPLGLPTSPMAPTRQSEGSLVRARIPSGLFPPSLSRVADMRPSLPRPH